MDCGEFEKPCDPNYFESALLYIKKAQVLMKDKDYPYIGKESQNGSCCINMKKCVHIHNLRYKGITSEKAMATSVEKRGPIPFAMRVNTCFFRFSGKGIFDDCYCCMTGNGTHAMTIIGFGHENGLDYWLIKNSWGKKWGDDGFAKIRRNIRLCGIDHYALEVKFQ
ncbi:pro-cathepsin H-like [Protopterus annectens]|uniref:pro-cathepsin H-like n=1 Tax=Protopterus annectens TaxID=7888 RepID=UPI001CFC4058|nr:pro-cathepsin H-like [Protopterus annectens]